MSFSWVLSMLGAEPSQLWRAVEADFVSEGANLESISTKPSQWTRSSGFSVDSYHPWVWYHLGR